MFATLCPQRRSVRWFYSIGKKISNGFTGRKIRKNADKANPYPHFSPVRPPLHLDVHVEQLVPRQPLRAQLGEERIGIELLDVEHAGPAPQTFGPHRSP